MEQRLFVPTRRDHAVATRFVPESICWLVLAIALGGRPLAGQTADPLSPNEVRESAAAADADQVATLIEQLSQGDLQSRRDAVGALAERGDAAPAVDALTAAIDDDDPQVRNGALQALGRIGPAAESAVTAIFAQLRQRDPQRRYRAAYAFGRAAPPDSPLLREGLAESAATVRAATVEAIGWMSDPPQDLVSGAAQLLGDEDDEVAATAQRTLQKIGPRALPPLVAALNHEQSTVQRRAAQTLEWLEIPLDLDGRRHLLDLCESQDASVHAAALTALAKVAADDPELTHAVQQGLAHRESAVVAAALNCVVLLRSAPPDAIEPLVGHVDASPEIASLAATALGRLGPAAMPAVPLLVQKLNAENQSLIVPAISALGPAAIPSVLAGAAAEHLAIDQAAEIISRIGPLSTPTLELAIKSDTATDRAAAAQALGRVRREATTTDLLVPLLADEVAAVRAAAAAGLAQLGPLAATAQPELHAKMTDEESAVRAQCLTALVATGAESAEMTPAILAGLQDTAPEVRRHAAIALASLEDLSAAAQSALVAALNDSDARVRQEAAKTLGREPETAQASAAALVQALQDAEPAVSLAAAEALTQVERLDESAVAALLPLLDHPSTDLRRTAVTALASGGDAARHAADRLNSLQQDKAPTVRAAATGTLAALAEDDASRLKILMAGLDDGDWTVRRSVFETLGDLGERAAAAVPRLLVLMQDAEDGEYATTALRRIDAAPAESIPLLLEILKNRDGNRRHRFYALYLLRKTGPAAREALPALRQLRDESEGRVRESYERAIRNIESGDSDD